MRTLTIRQPWAQAIAVGDKLIENRTWSVSYRGPVAIHAGAGWSPRGALNEHVRRSLLSPDERRHGMPLVVGAGLPVGAVIAVVELVDCHPDQACCRPWGESDYTEAGGRQRTVVYHLVFDNVRPLAEPVPARGKLGLWRPDFILAAAIHVALTCGEAAP